MKIVKAGYEILSDIDADKIYKFIEKIGRTCYKSESKITEDSAIKFVRDLVVRKHEAMIEHVSITVKFIVDRGVSHEIVRHRLASFAQESTRYCNYSKNSMGGEISVIEPVFFNDLSNDDKDYIINVFHNADVEVFYDQMMQGFDTDERLARAFAYLDWYRECERADQQYHNYVTRQGLTPEEARCILPTSLKTELIMTANLREWRHFFKLRAVGTTGRPHPQMSEVAVPLLKEFAEKLPAVFGDLLLKLV